MKEFLSINEILERDIKNETCENQNLFQIQGFKDTNNVKILYIGKFNYNPLLCILKQKIEDITCVLNSYLIPESDFMNNNTFGNNCNLIGFMMYDTNNTHKCSLNLIFKTNKKIELINNIFHEGHFEIQLNLLNNTKETIEKLYVYPGMEESIYKLFTVLVEQDVIGKINKKIY